MVLICSVRRDSGSVNRKKQGCGQKMEGTGVGMVSPLVLGMSQHQCRDGLSTGGGMFSTQVARHAHHWCLEGMGTGVEGGRWVNTFLPLKFIRLY